MSKMYSILEGLQCTREYKITEGSKFKREEFKKTEYDEAIDFARKHNKTEDDVHFDDGRNVWYVEYKESNSISKDEENYLNAEFEREVAELIRKYIKSKPKNRKCVLVSKYINSYVDRITSEERHKLEREFPRVIWGTGDDYFWVESNTWDKLKGITKEKKKNDNKKGKK